MIQKVAKNLYLYSLMFEFQYCKLLGIEEEARCAAFSITPPGVIEDDMDSYNDTSDQEWIPKPPLILPYKPVFVGPTNYDPTTSNSKK